MNVGSLVLCTGEKGTVGIVVNRNGAAPTLLVVLPVTSRRRLVPWNNLRVTIFDYHKCYAISTQLLPITFLAD